ncbi:ubiquitin specific protease 47 [Rhynchophorus ferrugineus]|uniref:ubiquitin specific protease 47 n=1 Tax=Rhynchophorus ferrugineus TaxID=354439 RepID=UPI003FCD16FC
MALLDPDAEASLKFSVYDSAQNQLTQSFITIRHNTHIDDVYKGIAEVIGYQPDEIDICFKSDDIDITNLSEMKDKLLLDFYPVTESSELIVNHVKYKNMSLCVPDLASEDDLSLGASASPTIVFANEDCLLPRCEPVSFTNLGRRKATQLEPIITESPSYVGLVNQAMTCYLNSMIQTLYMTPEFRNALYNWEFDGAHETRSIPYQLQKLFLNLQTSSKPAVETTDLTTSFGWQGSDAWHQHDVQELCRVMFDALEQKFKDTKQANLINDLYEGKMLDYVKCLDCGTEKSRKDSFLDIPLPVRPFGSTVAYNSVEEALRAFVQPETLDGNNQYFCEKCNKKCDAHKGLKFTKFPYLLTLHLKRFDFDYNSMHRIKLNDKVVFPEVLNLNTFIPVKKNEHETADGETTAKCDDCSTTDSGSADDESCQGTDLSSTVNGQDDNCADSDEGIDVSSGTNHHENEAKGPYVYELFSIMIHSGSASGGHYYAYIKDFDKNLWFCFNDQSVSPITDDDIRKTYGGGPQRTYYSGAFSSSTNAYMLMYRQIDKERNTRAMGINDFPDHIQKLLQNMRQKEEEDNISRQKQDETIKVIVWRTGPNLNFPLDITIPTYSDSTLSDVAQHAYNRFKLSGVVDQKDCRIVAYNSKNKCIDCSFESDDIRFHDIIQSYDLFYSDFMLEIREAGEPWKEYKKGGINMSAYPIYLESEDIGEPKTVRVDVGHTVADVKQQLRQALSLNSLNIMVILQSYTNEQKYFKDDTEIIQFDPNFSDYKLYVTAVDNTDLDNLEKHIDDFKKAAERYSHVIAMTLTWPVTDEGLLESLAIPSLDLNQNIDKNDQVSERGSSSPALRVSPQPGTAGTCGDGYDQSNSEDSSLSDSDRTLVGDAPTECVAHLSSSSASPADQHMTSPSDPCRDTYNYDIMGKPNDMSWDDTENDLESQKLLLKSLQNLTFKMTCGAPDRITLQDEYDYCVFKFLIDKRLTLEALNKNLEKFLGVPSKYFKLYKQHLLMDYELTRLMETMRSFKEGDRILIKLGRVLGEDEHLCKIYHLKQDNMEPNNLLFEHVVRKHQTMAAIKKDILQHAKRDKHLDIPYNRCRLREKHFKKPKKVYLDDQKFGDDVILPLNLELYLQELTEPETVTSNNQTVVFLRRWHPSTLTLGRFQEAILDVLTMDNLRLKVSEVSGIPLINLDVAYVKGNFPYDTHLLDIHYLEWNPKAKSLDQWPINVEDGCMFFYKHNEEVEKELTLEEKNEIKKREDARLGRPNIKNYSPGKERALKIYVLDSPPPKSDERID